MADVKKINNYDLKDGVARSLIEALSVSKADKSEIPSVDNLATQDYVNDKIKEIAGIEVGALPNDRVIVPEDYTFEQLEEFINANKGKLIKFPYNKQYTATKQLVIYDHENTMIDFNDCCFKAVDNWSVSSRAFSNDVYIGDIIITVCNSKNVLVENLIIDGNRANNSTLTEQTGFWTQNVDGLIARNLNIHSCESKMVIIYYHSKNVTINNITMHNLGSGRGCSYFFIADSEDGSYVVRDVYVENESIENTAQVFYVAGYNGVIENVHAKNVHAVADFRCGQHIIRNVFIDTCKTGIILQKYVDEEEVALSEVIVENVFMKNVLGYNVGAAGVFIVDCHSCIMNNIAIELNTESNYSWYGIRIVKNPTGVTSDIRNLKISNVKIINAKNSSIRVENVTERVYLNNIKHINNYYESPAFSVINGSGLTDLVIICDNIETEGVIISKVGNDILNNTYIASSYNKRAGATNERPSLNNYEDKGFCYLDTTLNKPIWWTGSNWVDATGANM